MTPDEDFQQTVRDYFGIEAQRHRDIMATLAETLSQITEINTSIDAKAIASAEAHASLRAAVEKTLADLAARSRSPKTCSPNSALSSRQPPQSSRGSRPSFSLT